MCVRRSTYVKASGCSWAAAGRRPALSTAYLREPASTTKPWKAVGLGGRLVEGLARMELEQPIFKNLLDAFALLGQPTKLTVACRDVVDLPRTKFLALRVTGTVTQLLHCRVEKRNN